MTGVKKKERESKLEPQAYEDSALPHLTAEAALKLLKAGRAAAVRRACLLVSQVLCEETDVSPETKAQGSPNGSGRQEEAINGSVFRSLGRKSELKD